MPASRYCDIALYPFVGRGGAISVNVAVRACSLFHQFLGIDTPAALPSRGLWNMRIPRKAAEKYLVSVDADTSTVRI